MIELLDTQWRRTRRYFTHQPDTGSDAVNGRGEGTENTRMGCGSLWRPCLMWENQYKKTEHVHCNAESGKLNIYITLTV